MGASCGCGGRAGLLVINSTVRRIPKSNYVSIQVNFENKLNQFPKAFDNIDIDFCFNYSIGPFFLKKLEKKDLFDVFKRDYKSKIKSSFESLVLFTQFDSYIKSDESKEEIMNFLSSKNLDNLNTLSDEEIKDYLVYCNNNIFRAALYNRVLSKIPVDSFSNTHPSEERTQSDQVLINKARNQIELDVYRTYPSLPISNDETYSLNFHSILYEIALRNCELGYTQGMNFICGFILMLCSNQRDVAFNIYIRLLSVRSKKFSLEYFHCFTNGFPLMNKYIEIFNSLLKEHMNKIYEKVVTNMEIVPHYWVGKWITLLFLIDVPFEVCIKFWDIILAYGLDYVVGISLAVCELKEKEILKCETIDEFNQVIHNGKIELKPKDLSKLYKIIFNDIKTNKYNLL